MTISEHGKTAGDIVAAGVTISTVLSWLPHVAAVLSIVWTIIRIYETRTVQKMFGRDDAEKEAG